MLSFKEAIDKAGKKRFGKIWESIVIDFMPTILPDCSYDASSDEISLAVKLLGRQIPPVIVKNHANEMDDSVPSFLAHSSLDLNFSDEEWSLAQRLSRELNAKLVDAHKKLLRLLYKFAVSAARGSIVTYIRRSDNLRTKNSTRASGMSQTRCFSCVIDPRGWNHHRQGRL